MIKENDSGAVPIYEVSAWERSFWADIYGSFAGGKISFVPLHIV